MNIFRRQPWTQGWQSGPWDFSEEKVAFFRRQPEPIRNLMLRFPPYALVRSNRAVKCPAPGTVGIVSEYLPPSLRYPDGAIVVLQSPRSSSKGKCRPGWLEVVGYHRGLNPSVMSSFLAGA